MNLDSISEKGMVFFGEGRCRRVQPRIYMEENLECRLKCGKQEELQGVAVTIGRRTFHLFYLCDKCGNVSIKELQSLIGRYNREGKQ